MRVDWWFQCDFGNRLFIPRYAQARPMGNDQVSTIQFEWLGEYRVGPILPFEPMSSLRDAHQMCGDLRVQVRGHWNARRARDRGRAQPPRHAADSHEIRHDVVTCTGTHSLIEESGPIEILPELAPVSSAHA